MKGFRTMVLVFSGVAALAFAACETAKDGTDESGNGDLDAVTVGDSTTGDSTAQADTGGGGGLTACEEFCDGVVAACPEEDTMETCLHSCEGADNEPNSTAIECATSAADCNAVHSCWAPLFN